MRARAWLLALVLLGAWGCPASDGSSTQIGGVSADDGYCSDSFGDDAAPERELLEIACSEAPKATILYSSSQLGIGDAYLGGSGDLAVDDSALYLSIRPINAPDVAPGIFRLKKDGSGVAKLSDVVLDDLVVADGWLYGVTQAAVSGGVVRIDTKTGSAQTLGAEGGIYGLRRAPDGRLFVVQGGCSFFETNAIGTFDPESGAVTKLVDNACVKSFAVGTGHIAWLEMAMERTKEEDIETSIHVANLDGSDRRMVIDPIGDPNVLDLQVAHDNLYFALDYSLADADLVRVPISGGSPECLAHVALSMNAVSGDALFALDSSEGPPACVLRYGSADGTSAVAQVQDNALNSQLVFDADFAYATALTRDGAVVIRIPIH